MYSYSWTEFTKLMSGVVIEVFPYEDFETGIF